MSGPYAWPRQQDDPFHLAASFGRWSSLSHSPSTLWNARHMDFDTCKVVRGILLLEKNSCSTCGVAAVNWHHTVLRYMSVILFKLPYPDSCRTILVSSVVFTYKYSVMSLVMNSVMVTFAMTSLPLLLMARQVINKSLTSVSTVTGNSLNSDSFHLSDCRAVSLHLFADHHGRFGWEFHWWWLSWNLLHASETFFSDFSSFGLMTRNISHPYCHSMC